MKIYIVLGTYGVYADRDVWVVGSYENKKEAINKVKRLEEWATESKEKIKKVMYEPECKTVIKEVMKHKEADKLYIGRWNLEPPLYYFEAVDLKKIGV